jgi:hypothetical protein
VRPGAAGERVGVRCRVGGAVAAVARLDHPGVPIEPTPGRLLSDQEQAFGSDHPDTLTNGDHIARSRGRLSDVPEAVISRGRPQTWHAVSHDAVGAEYKSLAIIRVTTTGAGLTLPG